MSGEPTGDVGECRSQRVRPEVGGDSEVASRSRSSDTEWQPSGDTLAAAVLQLNERAGIPVSRIVEAVTVTQDEKPRKE